MSVTRNNSFLLPMIFILLIVGSLLLLAYFWSELTYYNIHWQKKMNSELATLMQDISENNWKAGFILISVSFLYGLLHAIGPGHGKVIITAYISTHPTKLKKSAWLSVFASLLQGMVAIFIVTIILFLFDLSSVYLRAVSRYLENASYLLISLSGFIICVQTFRHLLRHRKKQNLKLQKATRIMTEPKCPYKQPFIMAEQQCCGHKHVITSEDLPSQWRSQLAVLLAIGCRPCSGALLVLLFSYALNIYYWGVVATIAMAIGTATTISLIALVVCYMRNYAYQLLTKKSNTAFQYIGVGGRVLVGLFFIFLGILMFNSSVILKAHDVMPLFR